MTQKGGISRRRLVGQAGTALAVAAGLPGCVSPLRREAPQLYTLTPKSTFDEGLPDVEWQLLVESPAAAAGLDSLRVALQSTPLKLDYFANVAWTDRAPLMVQTLIVESFENSGKIVSVGRETIGLRANYVLKTELREFQAEYIDGGLNQPPKVNVRMNAKLVEIPRRAIIAGDNFEAYTTSRSNNLDAIVEAFDETLGKVLRRLVEWTLVAGEEHWRERDIS
ncbi:MAG: hypothetical protein HKM95_17975 [Inquilinus sp.]|nr:hypothetical protein [Inquilinus sp.]